MLFEELGMDKPKVSIIVVTYNKKECALECIKSLKRLDYQNYEIMIIDNGSTDGTSEAIQQSFPDVKLIHCDRNLGVSRAYNLGIKRSDGEYVLLFDHDLIASRTMLSELIAVAQGDPKIGLVGPIIYYYEDPRRVWAFGTSVNLITGKGSFNAWGQIDNGQFDQVIEVQVLPTYMIKREVFKRIGLLDEIFFLTYEDNDICFRAREAGYKSVCAPKAKAWHIVPLDRRASDIKLLSRTFFIAKNRIIFMKKHAKSLNFLIFILFFLPLYTIWYSVKALSLKSISSLINFWCGILSGLSSIPKCANLNRRVLRVSEHAEWSVS
jgi:GT2 family glycosyltransferase